MDCSKHYESPDIRIVRLSAEAGVLTGSNGNISSGTVGNEDGDDCDEDY